MDPEIQAMSEVSEALSNLDDSARERVLRWAVDRYGASSGISAGTDQDLADQSSATDTTLFSHLSELYDAANPSTLAERVLVASYWFQEVEGQPAVHALTVNNALKQLGYGIGNITREFTKLQAVQPALILQLQKKGSAKQARKKYKVTAMGIQRVKEMVSGA